LKLYAKRLKISTDLFGIGEHVPEHYRLSAFYRCSGGGFWQSGKRKLKSFAEHQRL
jgi:hypothetical protein